MTQATQDPLAGLDPKIRAMVPPGVDIYDALMGEIEPELLSVNLPVLDRVYAKESKADRAKRMQRYKKAFEQYDLAFQSWLGQLNKEVDEQRRDAFEKAETQMASIDAGLLSKIESSMDEAGTAKKPSKK